MTPPAASLMFSWLSKTTSFTGILYPRSLPCELYVYTCISFLSTESAGLQRIHRCPVRAPGAMSIAHRTAPSNPASSRRRLDVRRGGTKTLTFEPPMSTPRYAALAVEPVFSRRVKGSLIEVESIPVASIH